jgi:microcystin-dependent protein
MATLVSGISVSNGSIITPTILNAAPTLTPGTVAPSDLTAGAPTWTSGGNATVSGTLTSGSISAPSATLSGVCTASSFVGSGASLTGIVTIPSGVVLPFAYNFTSSGAPSGWLICDGTQYSTSAYPALYALIGTSYGSGVGTFAVPNLQGLFIRGKGTQTTGGVTYTSAAIGTVQQDQFQGHYHAVSSTAIQGAGPGGAVGNPGGNLGAATITVTNPTTDGTDGTPRYGTETRPVNYAMIYCIKT